MASSGVATVRPGGAPFRLTFTVPGAARVDVGLSRFAEYLSDLQPFWREYAIPLLADRTIRNFETEGGFVGGWAPLSPLYAAWKLAHYGVKPILQREGRLIASLRFTNAQIGPGGIAEIEKDRAAYGTTVPYGLVHQVGRRRPPMPKRQVIAVPDSETWGRTLQRYAVAVRKRAQLGHDT